MKASTGKQNFKIGRMTYGLPGSFKDREEREFLLTFTYDHSWTAAYVCTKENWRQLTFAIAEAHTFNGAIKAMHEHLKTL